MSPTYTPSAQTTAALSALNSYQAPNAQDVTKQAQDAYGVSQEQQRVSDLQGNTANLESSINAVDPSVTGRTSGTFTTEAQRAALVSKEQQPLQTDLSNNNTSLGNEETTLNQDNSNAASLASAMITQNQNQYQKLLDAYNASAAQDQATEQSKEYYAGLAATTAANAVGSPTLNIGAPPTGSTPPGQSSGAQMSQRTGGGFNFSDANGRPISAATFAAEKGIPFTELVSTMAAAGDSGAKALEGVIGNDFGYNPNKVNNQQLANIYNSFIWGTRLSQAKPYVPVKAAPAPPRSTYSAGSTNIIGQKFKL